MSKVDPDVQDIVVGMKLTKVNNEYVKSPENVETSYAKDAKSVKLNLEGRHLGLTINPVTMIVSKVDPDVQDIVVGMQLTKVNNIDVKSPEDVSKVVNSLVGDNNVNLELLKPPILQYEYMRILNPLVNIQINEKTNQITIEDDNSVTVYDIADDDGDVNKLKDSMHERLEQCTERVRLTDKVALHIQKTNYSKYVPGVYFITSVKDNLEGNNNRISIDRREKHISIQQQYTDIEYYIESLRNTCPLFEIN